MEALSERMAMLDAEQLTAVNAPAVILYGTESTGLAAETIAPHPAVSMIGVHALGLSQALISRIAHQEEEIAGDITASGQQLGSGWLELIELDASVVEDESTTEVIEKSSAQAEDSCEDDASDSKLTLEPEEQEPEMKTENEDAAKNAMRSWGGGGSKKNCVGCGERTKKPMCGKCDGKHASKSNAQLRDEHTEKGIAATTKKRTRGGEAEHTRSKENKTGAYALKLAMVR